MEMGERQGAWTIREMLGEIEEIGKVKQVLGELRDMKGNQKYGGN